MKYLENSKGCCKGFGRKELTVDEEISQQEQASHRQQLLRKKVFSHEKQSMTAIILFVILLLFFSGLSSSSSFIFLSSQWRILQLPYEACKTRGKRRSQRMCWSFFIQNQWVIKTQGLNVHDLSQTTSRVMNCWVFSSLDVRRRMRGEEIFFCVGADDNALTHNFVIKDFLLFLDHIEEIFAPSF